MKNLKNQTWLLTIIVVVFFSSLPIKAQVTIGSLDSPQTFSILELTNKQKDGGLRMPQLTEKERDEILTPLLQANTNGAAEGLAIYNLTHNCLEFWNGTTWISLCSDILADCNTVIFPALITTQTLCYGSTFDDLTTAIGENVKWFDDETGGSEYLSTDPLEDDATYYAEQSKGNCKRRVAISVTLGDCSIPNDGRITTFTNVMYDFQYQTLEAYRNGGGLVTGWQWKVGTSRSGPYEDIPGANSAFYTVPANYIFDYSVDELFFTCELTNPSGTVTVLNTNALSILFIRTTDGQGNCIGDYGIDNSVSPPFRYLTIQRGLNGEKQGGNIKIALLNLGASGMGSRNTDPKYDDSHNLDNAGDLGDFYQWGRIPDGHQHTVWEKDRSTTTPINSITPFNGGGSATSKIVDRVDASHIDPSTGQVWSPPNPLGSDFHGNFILHYSSTSGGDWGTGATGNSDLWGNIYKTREMAPVSLNEWSPRAQDYNPCPTGWRVPSRYEIWDIYLGDGDNEPYLSGTTSDPLDLSNPNHNNKWQLVNRANNAFGGAVVTNNHENKVFIPACGSRSYMFGTLNAPGSSGSYWTSTFDDRNYAFKLLFQLVNNFNPTTHDRRSFGYQIRCVADPD